MKLFYLSTSFRIRLLSIFLTLIAVPGIQAQTHDGLVQYKMAGSAIAAVYGNCWVTLTQPVSVTGSPVVAKVSALSCTIVGGPSIQLIAPSHPVLVQDGSGHNEIITPSQSQCSAPGDCSLTAVFHYPHPAGATLESADDGLTEAVDAESASGGGIVRITPGWHGTTAEIMRTALPSDVLIRDERAGNEVWYAANRAVASPVLGVTAAGVSATTLNAANVEGVLYAEQFPGTDMGQQINNAIASLPADGGTVMVPAGEYSFATTILKPRRVRLEGEGSSATVLDYTGSGAAIVVADTTGQVVNDYRWGSIANLSLVSPATSNGSIGIYLGGDPSGSIAASNGYGSGEFIQNVSVSNFATGVEFGNNAWLDTFLGGRIYNNQVGVFFPGGLIDAGENISFFGTSIFNNQGPGMKIDGGPEIRAYSVSFDFNGKDAGPAVTGDLFSLECFSCHFEQQNGPEIVGTNSAVQYGVHLVGGILLLDSATGSDTAFVDIGGTNSFVRIDGTDFYSGHPVTQAVDFESTGANRELSITNIPYAGGGGYQSLTNPLAPWPHEVINDLQGNSTWGPFTAFTSGLQVQNSDATNGLDLFDSATGASMPHKYFRVANGNLQVWNSRNTAPIWQLSDAGRVAISSLQLGSDSPFSASPRMLWTSFFPGSLNTTWTGSQWTPDKAVIVTRLEAVAKTGPVGCTSNAVVQISNGTESISLTLSGNSASQSASTPFAAGTVVTAAVVTPAAGCTTFPADINFVVQYRMQ